MRNVSILKVRTSVFANQDTVVTEKLATVSIHFILICIFSATFYRESDIDECMFFASNNCDENATFSNTNGSYSCQCNVGFGGNGVSCTSY